MATTDPIPDCPGCAKLARRVEELEELVRQLMAKAGSSSRNSSRPPSSDPPWMKPRSGNQDGKRRRGGQPGRKKSERELKPTDEVDEVQICRPECCGTCGKALEGDDPDPRRHQTTEIPPIRPRVTEYQLHRLRCVGCGESTLAKLPTGVPQGAFGPRLQAMIAVLTGTYRVSRRNVQQLLSDMFGVTMSLGAISKLEGQVGEMLAGPHTEVLKHIRACAVVHADETSWRESNAKSWLWVSVGGDATAFLIRDNRSSEVAKELLGEEMAGTLITDRWSGYGWVDIQQRQLCWAHIIRDFRKIAESGEKAREIGEGLGLWANALFTYWHQLQSGALDQSRWEAEVRKIRKAICRLLKKGSVCGEWRAPALCRGILKVESALWTFATTPGVEPTNNGAERAIRPAVIWRKTSLGTQSHRGSRFAERMLTCVSTLRQRGKNVLDFVHAVCQAGLFGTPTPSLLADHPPTGISGA